MIDIVKNKLHGMWSALQWNYCCTHKQIYICKIDLHMYNKQCDVYNNLKKIDIRPLKIAEV